ncbi:MAG: mechanosensitive ion channel family protein, partial [Myxococcota bacterium]
MAAWMESLGPWVLLAAGAALVFAVLSRLFGGRRAALRFGVLLLVFFGTAYLTLRAGWGDFLDPLASRPALLHGAATCWWITAAYTANAALRRWVWHGVLLVGGKPAVPRLLTNLVSAFLYLVAIMVVLYFVYEKPITGVAAASGVLVFLIGYSAQPTLGELFAGIALNFSRPFEPGDSVIVGDVEGTVMDIDWRSVSILSLPGNLTVIPNSQAAGSTIVNYDRPSATVLRHLEFEADYGVAPVRVSEVV